MKKSLIITLTALYLVALPVTYNIVTAQSAPASLSFALVGGTGNTVALNSSNEFSVQVRTNTGGAGISGADAHVTFNTTQLTYKRSSFSGSAFSGPTSTNTATTGVIKLSANIPLDAGTPAVNSSSALIGTITFSPINTIPTGGLSTTLGFVFNGAGAAGDSRVTSYADGSDILGSVTSLTAIITAYVPAAQTPVIASLNPNSGVAAGGYDVVINASTDTARQFGSTAGTVTWNGTAVSLKSGTSWSATQLTIVAPQGTAGTSAPVAVRNATTNLTSAAVNFSYNTAAQTPVIASLNPNSGVAAGGYDVVINASTDTARQFGSTAGTVTWNGTAVSLKSGTSWSATQLTIVAPQGTAGTSAPVAVRNATTNLTSAAVNFSYNTAGSTNPYINTIVPSSGSEDGNTSVTLTGTNFGTTEGTVTIGGVTVSASNVTPWSDTSITFITPAYAVSGDLAVNVSITTSASVTSNTIPYTYLDEDDSGDPDVSDTNPNIAYLTPASGLANADVTVTIVGTNFKPTGTTTGTVRFGNYSATILSWEDTQIRVYAPKLGAIPSDITHIVTVTRSDTKFDTDLYTYLAPASTGGTGGTGDTTTPGSGMPSAVWFGLFSLNGGLAFLAKRKFLA